jgi:hypothetical protein
MNGLASLLRYQMGGPVGYVDGGQIDSIYRSLFNRPADEGGKAYYEALLKDRSVADAIAIIGGGATGEDVNEVSPIEIAGKAIAAAYSDTLSRSVDEIDPEGLTYYLGQVLYEGLDPTRIDDIFADSPEAQQFEAKLPGITDILKKDAAGGSYSVYTPPPVVTPPAVTDDTGAGAGAGAGAGTGVVTDDTGAGDKIIEPAVDGVNYPYLGDPDADPGRKQITVLDEAGNIVSGPPDKVIPGIPTFARQTPSNLTFAPLRRGLGQLRPAMSMTGLTSGQAAFGGVALAPGQSPPDLITAQDRAKELIDRTYRTVLNRNPTQVGYNFYLPKILSGELNANNIIPTLIGGATSGPDKEVAANYAIQNPSAAQPFTLQTGAYGAPTPTFLALPEKAAEPSPGQTNATVASNNLGEISGDGSGDSAGPDPGGFDAGPNDSAPSMDTRAGGLIRMAEGGEPTAPPTPPKMTELFPSDLGSTFDINDYIDDQGRLVGGMSKPIRDEYGKIIGYESGDLQGVSPEMPLLPLPIQRDVVFNPRLREREAMGVSPEEQEMALRAMIARQGLTGVNPMTGGLPGIMAREAVMRRRPKYYDFAEGGLANAAQNLAARGRYGDSTLVHMAPEELSGLRALARAQGNDMTINPRTGLPEAFSLRKLFKAASFILPFVPIPGLFGMSSLLTKSILSGVAAGASAKGGFDLKQALGGGLRAYAMGSLGEKLGGGPAQPGGPTAPTTTSVPDAAAVTAPTVTVPGVDGDISLASSYTGPGSTPLGPQSLNANLTAPLKVGSSYTDVAAAPIDTYTLRGGPQTGEAFYNKYPSDAVPVTGGSLPPSSDTVPGRMASVVTPEGQGFGKPITKGFDIAATGLGGFSLEKAAEETRRADIEAAAVKQEDEERKRRFDELFARTLGSVRTAKAGGTINLAKGGMTYMEAGGTTGPTGEPRMVQGTGDGMSDSVPATIEGVQEARLANDEFVIPADVVADIGNGSSNAGAKKLYNMMDRIRKARHGTTKQPPEIRAERLMPA